MADTMLAVHQAVFDALEAGVAAATVHTHAPEGTAFPYVEISRHIADADDALSTDYLDSLIYLTVWSEYQGTKQVLEILAEIHTALHNVKLTLTTGASLLCRVVDRTTSMDTDGKTHMGQATVRVMSQNV